MQNLLKSILAGLAISIGGVAYLSSESSVMGAFLFGIGLFMIYLFDWNLYTGKACYVLTSAPKHMFLVLNAFVGNFIGTVAVAYLLRITKLSKLIPKAQSVAESKLANTNFSGFIMAIGCGLLMYVAVIGYKTVSDNVGKYIILFMPIVVFTISGFEHVIANMFYFSMADVWSLDTFSYLLIVAMGNLVGCSLVPFANKFLNTETVAH